MVYLLCSKVKQAAVTFEVRCGRTEQQQQQARNGGDDENTLRRTWKISLSIRKYTMVGGGSVVCSWSVLRNNIVDGAVVGGSSDEDDGKE